MNGCDWSYRGDYVRERQGIEPDRGNEAMHDPGALRISPDPSSRSGRSDRTISYSPAAGCLLTVITLADGPVTYGVNGWRSNSSDARRYKEEAP